jgi:hypothetical protein
MPSPPLTGHRDFFDAPSAPPFPLNPQSIQDQIGVMYQLPMGITTLPHTPPPLSLTTPWTGLYTLPQFLPSAMHTPLGSPASPNGGICGRQRSSSSRSSKGSTRHQARGRKWSLTVEKGVDGALHSGLKADDGTYIIHGEFSISGLMARTNGV